MPILEIRKQYGRNSPQEAAFLEGIRKGRAASPPPPLTSEPTSSGFDPEVSRSLIRQREVARRGGHKDWEERLLKKEREAEAAHKKQTEAQPELQAAAKRIKTAMDELIARGEISPGKQFYELSGPAMAKVIERAEQLKKEGK